MQYRFLALALMIALLPITALTACTSLTGETVGQNIDDVNVTAAVKAKLAGENASTLTRVGVQTVQGTVYLTGIVPSEAMREHATDLALQVRGVRSVVNNLRIQARPS